MRSDVPEGLRDPLLLLPSACLRHGGASSVGSDLSSAGSQPPRSSPCTLRLAYNNSPMIVKTSDSAAPVLHGTESSGSFQTTNFRINHNWHAFSNHLEFWLRDQFHQLLSLSFRSLVGVLVVGEALFALFMAALLFVMTRGDARRCLGAGNDGLANYYYFAIETMFTIGFGSPRYPSCTAANLWTSGAVLFTNVVNGLVVGIIFSKFSSGATRRYALSFSPSIVGSLQPTKFRDQAEEPRSSSLRRRPVTQPGQPPPTASPLSDSTRDATGKVGHADKCFKKLYSNVYSGNGILNSSGLFGNRLRDDFDYERALAGLVTPDNNSRSLTAQSITVQPECIGESGSSASSHFSLTINPTPQAHGLEYFEDFNFALSFRFMNLTECAFFEPKMTLFLLKHEPQDLVITQVMHYYTDLPLQFLELPVTVTIDDIDLSEGLGRKPLSVLLTEGERYELMVLLSFVDNQSSRVLELRKSWRLSEIQWGYSFQSIVKKQRRDWQYQVDVECLDNKVELTDQLNVDFNQILQMHRAF